MARPFIIGLTGAMGMGKSETARLFAAEGVPVFDADGAVHQIYAAPGPLADAIERLFPGAVGAGGVARDALMSQMTPEKLEKLEALIHPEVAAARARFLAANAAAPIVLLDIPLLLEAGIATDAVVAASAPPHIQRARVMARPGMTQEKFAHLAARQWPDEKKRQQAHYVVMTHLGLDHARDQVKMILADIRNRLAEA